MLFNSIDFIFFLVAVLILYWSAPDKHSKWILLGASYYFYAYAYPFYALLLAGLTIINFYLGDRISKNRDTARRFLILGIVIDLSSIGFYKYSNLLLETLNVGGGLVGMTAQFPVLNVVLPIGISFYTFQMISYLVDVYRGSPAERSFRDFALYVSFFTQLVAGPIVRPSVLLPQIKRNARADSEKMQLGLFLIMQGLIKKIVLADTLGRHVDAVFAAPAQFDTISTLIAVYAYAFQIYFDFSGYTDIAIGCGKLLGFDLPDNFNLPYMARNMREFWQRWHISLSTWLRDYLYITLGGSRKNSRNRTYLNLGITMVLGGLWHGANWTFAIWGLYHGVLIIANHIRRGRAMTTPVADVSAIRKVLGIATTFHLVCFGWIFFRAPTFSDALLIIQKLTAFDFSKSVEGLWAALMIIMAMASHAIRENWSMEERFIRLPTMAQGWIYGILAVAIYVFFTTEQRFIYFQF
jgi:alginate O-acetyltransferase complex protein AlgI